MDTAAIGAGSRRANLTGAHGDIKNKVNEYALTVITANVSCWKSAQRFLTKYRSAEVVLIQEHKISSPRKLAGFQLGAQQWLVLAMDPCNAVGGRWQCLGRHRYLCAVTLRSHVG